MPDIIIGANFIITVLVLVIAVCAILLMIKAINFTKSTSRKDAWDYVLITIFMTISVYAFVWSSVKLINIYL